MLNRREAIAVGVGLLVGRVPVTGAEPENETQRMCREHPAQFACEWELCALRSNCPNGWQRWKYATGVQWNPAQFILLGVGPAEHCRSEFARHCEAWSDSGLLQAHIEPDGRAWALLIEGRLSNDLREELRQSGPSFSTVQERRYRDVETGLDEELEQMMAER